MPQIFKQDSKLDPALILQAYDTQPDQAYILAVRGPNGEDLGGLRDIAGVGLGIDSGQPGIWVPGQAPFTPGGNTVCVANRGEYCRFVCPRSMVVTKAALLVMAAATADDPCDVGVMNAAGTQLLGSSGPTTGKLNVLGNQVINFAAPISLVGGQIYYSAFACGPIGGTAAQLWRTSIQSSGSIQLASLFGATPPNLEQGYQANRYPLPNSSGMIVGISGVPIMALLQ